MNFDRIAGWYRRVEYLAFGRRLERCRAVYLERAREARRILILGEGDGRYLRSLLEVNANAEIDVIEASAAMIELARTRVGSRTRFYHSDARLFLLRPNHYDLVVTHFFLDCFRADEAVGLIARIAQSLQTEGCWIVSEFQQPPAGIAAVHARVWILAMYAFFQMTAGLRAWRLPPVEQALRGAGLEKIASDEQFLGLITAQCWIKRA